MLTVVLFGLYTFFLNTRISLPDAVDVTWIEMEYFGGRWARRARFSKESKTPDDIEEIMAILSGARRIRGSRFQAMNEEPLQFPREMTIRVTGDGLPWSYLYTSGNRGYWYFPYEGIYRLCPDSVAEIYYLFRARE